MHELPITQSILDISLQHAEAAGGTRITDIHIVMGQLSSFVDDSIQTFWGIIAKDTIAEGAILHFKRIPAEFECRDCGETFKLREVYTCPSCGGMNLKIIAGEECHIEAIDIETDESKKESTT